MINFPINASFPVIIVASPRTGSGALSWHIKNLHVGIEMFNEPDQASVKRLDEFLRFQKTDNNWILKIMISSLDQYPDFIKDKINSGAYYRVKCSRRNLVDQIASHYVATIRDHWMYLKNDPSDQYLDLPVVINTKIIDRCISWINHDIKQLKTFEADTEIFYEDVKNLLNSGTKKTPLPTNYEEIKAIIKQRL